MQMIVGSTNRITWKHYR